MTDFVLTKSSNIPKEITCESVSDDQPNDDIGIVIQDLNNAQDVHEIDENESDATDTSKRGQLSSYSR